MSTIADRYAAAQRATLTTAVEAAILDGTTTAAAVAAATTLEDIAAEHEQSQRIHRYIGRVETEARAAAGRLSDAFDARPDATTLAALDYAESIVSAAIVARRLLRTPELLTAAMAVERVTPTGAHPWRLAHGALALSLIDRGAQPDALDRLDDLLSTSPVKP